MGPSFPLPLWRSYGMVTWSPSYQQAVQLARHKVSKSCNLQTLSSHTPCSHPHPKVDKRGQVCRRWATGPVSIDSASEREPQSLLQALVLSLALSCPAFLHRHGPMAWYGERGTRPLAWSDPCSGLGLCLLAHLSLASSGKATCSGSHEGREGGAWEPRETGSAIWSMTCPGMALC